MKYELIPDWKHAWKWFSTNALAISGAIPATWSLMPKFWQDHNLWMLNVLTPAVVISGIIGRVIQKKPSDCDTTDSNVGSQTDSSTSTGSETIADSQ